MLPAMIAQKALKQAKPTDAKKFGTLLLAWYDNHSRVLPWRDYAKPDAYRIWLAEIMLQQTTVAAVVPYYRRFLEAFPTVQALAAAPVDDVLRLWQGLGYYRRAHLLHACAKVVAERGGLFPDTEEGLLALPGIGPYTAAAIRALAFNKPASVLDGNVERVVSRVYRWEAPLPAAKPQLRTLAAALAEGHEPRVYANAIMELGATVCTPKSPKCLMCPVRTLCASAGAADVETYPRKAPKKALPRKRAVAYAVVDGKGRIWLRQRPAKGLLGGLWEVPHTGWENTPLPFPTPAKAALAGVVGHTFTHFHLEVEVRVAKGVVPEKAGFAGDDLPPLSTLMRKVVEAAQRADATPQ